MSSRNLLFVVEGENDEPAFLRRLFLTCYPSQSYQTYTYRTNLHVLAAHLERDYPNFDREEIDIRLILRSYEKSDDRKKVLSLNYTDIFLIFDFEPQHDHPHFDTIRRMLALFNDSTMQGKLFINYPMMQAYKHFAILPDPNFYDTKVTEKSFKQYKRLVGSCSGYKDINLYTYPIFMSLAAHHLKKANYILHGTYILPDLQQYLTWSYTDIFDKQRTSMEQEGWIYVLNTCIFVLADYKPSSFFRQLTNNQGGQFFL